MFASERSIPGTLRDRGVNSLRDTCLAVAQRQVEAFGVIHTGRGNVIDLGQPGDVLAPGFQLAGSQLMRELPNTML